MAKWFNTATGAQVPAEEVRELSPGTGVYVHEKSVTYNRVVPTLTDRGRVLSVDVESTTGKQVDGFAVRLADDEAYDPNKHNLAAQVRAMQAAQRARLGRPA